MWLTREERVTLTVLGLATLVGLGVLLWQRQRPPLVIAGEPTPAQAAQSLDSASRPRSGFRSTGQPRGASWDEALAAARQVDINTASVAELERLPEIGPGLAKRIVEYRQQHGRFSTSEALMRVRGVGPKKYQSLEPYVVVR